MSGNVQLCLHGFIEPGRAASQGMAVDPINRYCGCFFFWGKS